MDSNSFIGRLSMQSGLPAEEIAKRLDTLTSIIKNYCQELDAVAVPGFGTFTPLKKDECIETTATGKKTLLPPSITVSFKSSVVLRKSLGK